jgi:hypothetical protein
MQQVQSKQSTELGKKQFPCGEFHEYDSRAVKKDDNDDDDDIILDPESPRSTSPIRFVDN